MTPREYSPCTCIPCSPRPAAVHPVALVAVPERPLVAVHFHGAVKDSPRPEDVLVNRFRPWMEAFAASYWVLVMSYTCRVTSDMTGPPRRAFQPLRARALSDVRDQGSRVEQKGCRPAVMRYRFEVPSRRPVDAMAAVPAAWATWWRAQTLFCLVGFWFSWQGGGSEKAKEAGAAQAGHRVHCFP